MVAHAWDQRVNDQFSTIKEAFEKGPPNPVTQQPYEIFVTGPGTPGPNFMYVEHEVLVRDEYVAKVQDLIGTPAPTQIRRVVRGVVRHPIDRAKGQSLTANATSDIEQQSLVANAIREIERAHGRGVATPNHILTVAGVGGPCPATEPEQVDDGIEPFPAIRDGGSGGNGVLIYVADTGLVEGARVTCPWLHGVARADKPGSPKTPQDWDLELPKVAEGPNQARVLAEQTMAETIDPYVGHGTFVAGVARSMAPQADVIVANIFKTAGSAFESDFVADLDQALDLGVDIFNLSVTAPTLNDRPLLAFGRWLARAQEYKGVACVAAAGNSGLRVPSWPAACPDVLSVGALAEDWRSRAAFSNFGGWVDVYAPGRNLINAFAFGKYTCKDAPYVDQERLFYGMARWSGTSFSTPLVSGLIAARMSRTGENGKDAAKALLAEARAQAVPGTGAILLPYGKPVKDRKP